LSADYSAILRISQETRVALRFPVILVVSSNRGSAAQDMFRTQLDGVEQPPHPGEILREDILPRLDLSAQDLARHLAIQETTLNDVLFERQPMTVDLAQRLSAALGQSPRYWLALQMQFDLFRAALSVPSSITPIKWPRGVAT
jgi:antitoxin HigA-1